MRNRLKCANTPSQLTDRLQYDPEIIELHLFEDDLFGEKVKNLEHTITSLQEKGITVYLHYPYKYRGVFTDIQHEDIENREYYWFSARILHRICLTYNIKCVLHCYSEGSYSDHHEDLENVRKLRGYIEEILSWGGDVFLWENVIAGLFTHHNPYLFDEIIKPLNLPLVHDISHTFIGVKGDNEKLLEITKRIDPYVKYCHVVDSLGQSHDGLELGTGKVNWENLLPYIKNKPYIYEIVLPDNDDGEAMVRSNNYINSLLQK